MQLPLKQDSCLQAVNTIKKFLKILYRATSPLTSRTPRCYPPISEFLLAVLVNTSKDRVSLRIRTKRPTDGEGIQRIL